MHEDMKIQTWLQSKLIPKQPNIVEIFGKSFQRYQNHSTSFVFPLSGFFKQSGNIFMN